MKVNGTAVTRFDYGLQKFGLIILLLIFFLLYSIESHANKSQEDYCLSVPSLSKIVVVNESQLRNALKRVGPGGHIVINSSSIFHGDYSIDSSGTSLMPIRISGGDGYRPTFKNSNWYVIGSYVFINGLTLDGGYLYVMGDYNKIVGNWFINAKTRKGAVTIGAGSSNNLISFNDIKGFYGSGVDLIIRKSKLNESRFNTVSYNWIHENRGEEGNGHEGIRNYGDAYYDSNGFVFEYNLLSDLMVKGEDEAISVKTGGGIIRGNTLVRSPGYKLVNRFGDKNIWEFNVARKIYIYSDDNVVRQNIIGLLRIDSGDTDQDARLSSAIVRGPAHPTRINRIGHSRSRRTIVVNNKTNILEVGNHKHLPAEDNILINNSGVLRLHPTLQINTKIIEGTPNIPNHVKRLRSDDVGPHALRKLCNADLESPIGDP